MQLVSCPRNCVIAVIAEGVCHWPGFVGNNRLHKQSKEEITQICGASAFAARRQDVTIAAILI